MSKRRKNPHPYGSSRWEEFERRSLAGRLAWVKRSGSRSKKFSSPNNPHRVGTKKWAESERRSLSSRVAYAVRHPVRALELYKSTKAEPPPVKEHVEGVAVDGLLVLWDVESPENKRLRPTQDAFGALQVMEEQDPWMSRNTRLVAPHLPGEMKTIARGETFDGDSGQRYPWTLEGEAVGLASYEDIIRSFRDLIRTKAGEFTESSKSASNPSPWVHILSYAACVPLRRGAE